MGSRGLGNQVINAQYPRIPGLGGLGSLGSPPPSPAMDLVVLGFRDKGLVGWDACSGFGASVWCKDEGTSHNDFYNSLIQTPICNPYILIYPGVPM